MKPPIVTSLLCGAGLVLSSGCIHHRETVYRDVERARVEFENDTAARIFYETLESQPNRSRGESNTEVKLPLVFEHERKVVSGRNSAFNDAVAACDTNKDGRVTEVEARIFAEHGRR